MSVSDDLASALATMNAASQGLGQYNAAALAAIASVNAAFNARIATLVTQFEINQVTGVDTNVGSIAAPIRTIQRAIELTPPGGICRIRLQSDYTVTERVSLGNRVVDLESNSGVRRNLTFERYIETPNLTYRGVRGFALGPNGFLNIKGLTIHVPLLDGSFTLATPYNDGLFSWENSNAFTVARVSINECNYRIPASPFCPMFPESGLYNLQFFANTLDGAITSLNGQVIRGVTASGGTSAAGRADIQTNLTTI